jgi:uncharacterized protein (DUF1501 family)
MKRRDFLRTLGAGALLPWTADLAFAAAPHSRYHNLLVLIELKGGNDGLNSVIPYADPAYRRLRPRLAIARDRVRPLDEHTGLHPALDPLLPLWQAGDMAIVQGVGYPHPNLSHFRSIEIWDTASASDEYLDQGWLTRVFERAPPPAEFAADGVVVGGQELGPLAGGTARAIALTDPARFGREAERLKVVSASRRNPALAHLLKVEGDIHQAASRLQGQHEFRTEFPRSAIGGHLRTVAEVVATGSGVAVAKVSLNGFDTHSNQPNVQGRLLGELAAGVAAFKGAMQELGRWNSVLVLTYAEFGRRPHENGSLGTDHGTASAHFLFGGRVIGGLHGPRPVLTDLDGGNLRCGVDFRQLYATVVERWWSLPAVSVYAGARVPLDLVRA